MKDTVSVKIAEAVFTVVRNLNFFFLNDVLSGC